MTNHHRMQEQNAANWFSLRPAKAAICPRVVAGKHCLADSGSCACRKHHHLLDHGRIWLDEDGRPVLTGEPYDTGGDELAELVTDMATLGLRVFITGQSMWNPGYTLLIRITKHDPGDAA